MNNDFLCAICLEVFTDPVSTPCGHNFCKTCISTHWDNNVLFKCPLCNEAFNTRPQLKVNTMVSEMIAQFRCRERQVSRKSRGVLCDTCTGNKANAVKSCLVCVASYCETHLEPHLTAPPLRKHQLIEPMGNLEDRVCEKHQKPLELFCKTDQTCVCLVCPVLDHKDHEFVPLKEEFEGRKVELKTAGADVQKMIQERRVKIEEVKHLMKVSQDKAGREIAEGVQFFTALKESVDRGLDKFVKRVEDKQTAAEKQAEDVIRELEQEISELEKRSTEVEKLALSEDHPHLLQNYPSLKEAPPTKDWTKVRVCPLLYDKTVVKAVDHLEETLRQQMKTFKEAVELKKVREFEVEVTLDPDTATPNLILSDDGKQVRHGDKKKILDIFDMCACVLGKESFSSGRFYFEVQVKDKTQWDLGVVRKSFNRKGKINRSPYHGYWLLVLRNTEYKAYSDPRVSLRLPSPPEKIGVFVDYDKGVVSFYDVNTAALIYSFTGCSFTEKLHPYFGTGTNDGGKNSAPLIICPVYQNMRSFF
ncbi:E3 ubiquitin-protein ligase TRIM39-like [Cynoglossus semilaevis]|nr:E3 ubiquitin-protein ligase TRIM39-like [Cynoglossus semilaevis]